MRVVVGGGVGCVGGDGEGVFSWAILVTYLLSIALNSGWIVLIQGYWGCIYGVLRNFEKRSLYETQN